VKEIGPLNRLNELRELAAITDRRYINCFFMSVIDKSVSERTRPNGSTVLSPGTAAPDFELKSTRDQTVQLSEFRGQPVVLAFYPADWSPVCGDQMALYNEMLSEFQEYGAELLGISVDGAMVSRGVLSRSQVAFSFAFRF
jgi:hypothetical protein